MHDFLQDMGRKIVWEASINNPGKRSRLWYHKDVYEVLTKNLVRNYFSFHFCGIKISILSEKKKTIFQ